MCGHVISNKHAISISGLGDHKRTLYLWLTDDGVCCQAGSFFGALEEFKVAVTEKYDADHEYIKAADFLVSINTTKK